MIPKNEKIINIMKTKMSPAISDITKDNIKYVGKMLVDEVLEEDEMSPSWRKAIILPQYKKVDKRNCQRMALIDVIYKILMSLMKKRMEFPINSISS